jgi:hypothetical protein
LRPRGFAINSPPFVEAEEAFRQCLRVGESALNLHGMPRAGKTAFVQHLELKVNAAKEAVVASVFAARQARPTQIDQTEFWCGFLKALNHQAYPWSRSHAHDLLLNDLVVAADRGGTSRVVLIVDEAQNLVLQHFALLKLLVDELIKRRLIPFVLLAAQPDIKLRPVALHKAKCPDLVDRFFTRWQRLRGLTPEEFEDFLGAYDDEMRWPGPEGPTFTAYFAGPQVERGWNLRDEAPRFAEEFSKLNRKLALGTLKELETKFLTTSVRLLLTALQEANARGQTATPSALIEQCVRGSGFVEARQEVGDAENVIER